MADQSTHALAARAQSSRTREVAPPAGSYCCHIPHIRLGEFDMGGVLYHAHYFHLYEIARESFLKDNGLSYPQIVARERHLPLVESHQQFFAPIFYGQEIDVHLWIREIRRSSFTVVYRLYESGKPGLLHEAWTTLVHVTMSGEYPKVLPLEDDLKALLSRYQIAE